MATYALLKNGGTRVVNLIDWDGAADLALPAHLTLALYDREIHPDLGYDLPVGPGWRDLIPPPPAVE